MLGMLLVAITITTAILNCNKCITAMDKKICVIGAGISGLLSIKSCLENNLRVTCYEKTDNIGGLWRFRDETIPGVGSVMKSTVSVTSKEMSAFSDFPPAGEYPNYMDHSILLNYIEEYAENFKITGHIRFNTEVIDVHKAKDFVNTGQWVVSLKHDNGIIEIVNYDGVAICTGSFVFPHIPPLLGLDTFKGPVLHTHSYKNYHGFENQKVLVIGFGCSGTNVAVELSHVSRLPILLSTRGGGWILPRLADGGVPWDVLYSRRYLHFIFSRILPRSFVADFFEQKVNFKMDHSIYHVHPSYRISDKNATVEDDLALRVLSGAIEIKGEVDHFTPKGVVFKGEEDRLVPVDIVILATGYELKIPCVDESLLQLPADRLELYQFVFPITLSPSTMAVIGQVQPNGAITPVAEMQSRWVARVFSGKCKLPPQKQMQASVFSHNKIKRRNPYEVDWLTYMDTVAGFIGVKPQLQRMFFTDLKLFYCCVFGPTTPYQYRLAGPNSWPKARETILNVHDRVLQPLRTRKSTMRLRRIPFLEMCIALMITTLFLYFLLF